MKITSTIILLLFTFLANAQNPTELGTVKWYRDLDLAIKNTGIKPILILFQEVPGCSTCQRYGQQVLSHPLIVETIETYFTPVAIHNNKKGKDLKSLQFFNEPAWNNPVIRIVDNTKKDIVSRLSSNYSPSGLVKSMIEAMQIMDLPIPIYLELLDQELSTQSQETAFYTMYCFWSGEAHMGSKKGIIQTEAGFMQGKEVVKITYDNKEISKSDLDQHAAKKHLVPIKYSRDYRIDKEVHYYLLHSKYKNIYLTELQKTRVNSALGNHLDPKIYLSPRQVLELNKE